MNPGYDLDLLVTEKFFKRVRQEKALKGEGRYTHRSADGGWYPVEEYSTDPDRDLIWHLLDEIERLGWIFTYQNMKDGKRGHFFRLGYIKASFDSFHVWVESKGESLPHALCLALVQCDYEEMPDFCEEKPDFSKCPKCDFTSDDSRQMCHHLLKHCNG